MSPFLHPFSLILLSCFLFTTSHAQMGGGGTEALTNASIQQAVQLWASASTRGRQIVLQRWGMLETWDTSAVTDMKDLFQGYATFNDDVSAWDVSSVTDMEGMFHGASSFDQDLSRWDVSEVTSMNSMFEDATSFQGTDLSRWDTSSVTAMQRMFLHATDFLGAGITEWDMENVAYLDHMLAHAVNVTLPDDDFDAFSSNWRMRSAISMSNMFYRAQGLSGVQLCWPDLDVELVMDVQDMFCETGGMGFDPCCTQESLVQESCCAGDACSTACGDEELEILIEAAQEEEDTPPGKYDKEEEEVKPGKEDKPDKEQDFVIDMEEASEEPSPTEEATEPTEEATEPTEETEETEAPPTVIEEAQEETTATDTTTSTAAATDTIPTDALLDGMVMLNMTNTTNMTDIEDVFEPTTAEIVAMAEEKPATDAPAMETTAPVEEEGGDLFGSLMDTYEDTGGTTTATEAPQTEDTTTTTSAEPDTTSVSKATEGADQVQVVTGDLWATLTPIIVFILLFIIMIALMTYYGLAQGNPGYVVPSSSQKS